MAKRDIHGHNGGSMAVSRIVVLTDASRRTGFGHLRRCLTLCEALSHRGFYSFFVLGEADAAARAWMKKQSLPFCCAALSKLASIEGLCREQNADIVIIDTYRANRILLERLLDVRLRILVIDDLADRPLPSTWLTNSALSSGSCAYRRLTKGRLLLGPRYALLRPGFAGRVRTTGSGRTRNVLVAIGGSDPLGLTPRLLKALAATSERLHIRAVLGPLSRRAVGLESHSHCRIEILRDVRDMASLMRWADVAVAGAGQMLFELAAVGCPCVGIRIAPNQKVTIRLFSRIGSVVIARSVACAVERVLFLLDRPARRRAMSRCGQRAVDGLGAERIADALLRECAQVNENEIGCVNP